MKGSRRILIISLLILGVLALGLYLQVSYLRTGEQDENSFGRQDTITIVTDYSPVSYFVQDDTIVGMNKDLVDLFQTYTDKKLDLVLEASLQKSIGGLESGLYDIVARGIPVTTELKNKILFSNPIAQTKQILLQRKSSYNDDQEPIRSHLELGGKTIYVAKGSPAILRIKNLSREIGDTIYYVEDNLYGEEQLAIMVANKEIDFAVCDEKIAKRIAQSQPELDLETDFGFTQLEAWAVSSRKPQLLDSLNVWISRAKNEGSLDKIYKRYLR